MIYIGNRASARLCEFALANFCLYDCMLLKRQTLGNKFTPTHSHTHTHTLGFHVLWGISIDIMIFILYKLYILLLYTLKLTLPLNVFSHFQKT